MKEYVKDADEFKKLAKGRIHWAIRKEPEFMEAHNGNGVLMTGELNVVLSVSAIAKEDHLLLFERSYGRYFMNKPAYLEVVKTIHAFVAKDFPKATEGGWVLGH